MKSSFSRPQSDVPAFTGWLGVAGLCAGLGLLSVWSVSPGNALAILVFSSGIPMWAFEAARYREKRFHWSPPRVADLRMRLEDLAGLALVWFPALIFQRLATPAQFMSALDLFLSWVPWLAAPILILVFAGPRRNCTGTIGDLYRFMARKGSVAMPWGVIRAQLVKAFFLPLMLGLSSAWSNEFAHLRNPATPLQWYLLAMALLYLVDTVFGTIGYLSTSARLNAQIRSTDSTWLGWISALSCYPPFFGLLVASGVANYKNGQPWHHWIDKLGALSYLWGGSIVVLSLVYAWATVVFGVRFSNLTNRGVITHGPFKYSKHPAYISKNLSWWLISVPFLAGDTVVQSALNCCSLLFVNLIYFARAQTEERHMMRDPAYRNYAAWIAEHGLLARLGRWLGLRQISALRDRDESQRHPL